MLKEKRYLILGLMGIVLYLWVGVGEAKSDIVLKALVVNPSKIKVQEATLKAYLPKEAEPEDIVDLGDLKIDYDIEKALYYVYKKFTLKPGESAGRFVRIKDIWIISEVEIDDLNKKVIDLVERLKDTIYAEASITIQRDIKDKGAEILKEQVNAIDALPQTHIAVYRENSKRLEFIKKQLDGLRDIFVESRITDSSMISVKRVTTKMSWWMALAVIIFLGFISVVFFIIWNRQLGAIEKEKEKKEAPSLDI